MRLHSIYSATLIGLDARRVELEAAFNKGLPSFTITGMAQASIQEARHRSQSALCAIGFSFPPLKIVINLAPSDLPKYGSHFDLPIALLIALHQEELPREGAREWFALGELGLEGKLKDNRNIYPILLSLAEQGYEGDILLPKENESLYRNIPRLKMHFIASLNEGIEAIKNAESIQKTPADFPFSSLVIAGDSYYYDSSFEFDFADVKGQEIAKRAALIAAAGFHNILFEGSPGLGKSMIAKRLRYILPPLSQEEILKSAKARLFEQGELRYEALRNMRAPHATSTKAAILGSLAPNGEAKPGEIALAHGGILFLDELPHFPKSLLEALREPLENHAFVVSRAQAKVEFESSFLLVAAQNPCPCGNLLNPYKECRCNEAEIKRYKSRLSEPFLDRIDLFVAMQESSAQEHSQEYSNISSKELQSRVLRVFEAQKMRAQRNFNARLSGDELERFCPLSESLRELMIEAVRRFGLSRRAEDKVRRIARTIADLEDSPNIERAHILEALSFRRR